MIVKFFNRGVGRGSGPVDYLLGKDRNRQGATLDQGNPDQIQALIDSSDYAKKYTSGVLSFEESDLPRETKNKLMQEFEEALLPGLDKNQYSVLWVEHKDKDRLELNFVIPNVELQTNKRLQPYFDRADRPRINAWKEIKNHELGLSDPNKPEKAQALITPRDLSADKKNAAQTITKSLLTLAENGEIKSRSDIIKTLENSGFNVARETNKSISISDPEGGRNVRLKGAIYERNFKFSKELRAEIKAASSEYREATRNRVQEARATYTSCFKQKRKENRKRYKCSERSFEPSYTKDVVLVAYNANRRPDSLLEHYLVAGTADHKQSVRNQSPEPEYRAIEEARRENQFQQLRQTFVHSDRRESARISRGLQNNQRVLDDDGVRKAAFERIRAVTERFRNETQRVSEILQRAREYVSNYTERKRTNTTASQNLKRTGRDLNRSIKSFSEEVDLNRKQVRKKSRSRGFGMGF